MQVVGDHRAEVSCLAARDLQITAWAIAVHDGLGAFKVYDRVHPGVSILGVGCSSGGSGESPVYGGAEVVNFFRERLALGSKALAELGHALAQGTPAWCEEEILTS